MNTFYPINVKPLDDYKLEIVFNNKETRLFDVKPYLSDPFFSPIKNPTIFKTVEINPLTVEWQGEIDICPDELYYNSVPV